MDETNNLPEPEAEGELVETTTEAPEDEDTPEAATPEDDTPEDTPEDEEPEPAVVDVKFDGKDYSVPPELKDALLRQSDYTRKMQDISGKRKELEAKDQTLQRDTELHQLHIDEVATIKAIEQQLQAYEAVDWETAYNDDPVEAMKLDRQQRGLQDNKQQALARLQENQRQAFEHQRVEHAKLLEKGQAALEADIPGWDTKMAEKTRDYALKEGYTAAEVSRLTNHRHVKTLNKARLYDELVSKQATKPKPAPAQPAAKVKGARQGGSKDPEKMGADEWVRWRNKQVAKRNA
jgi:hypothetical protein